jgi:dTDP-4-amino-4,6-dideoxygalactose transaminase
LKPLRTTLLKFNLPLIGEDEIDEIVDTLRTGWITTGPKTNQFEKEFRDFLGAPEALAVNSCTAAMHTALATLGIGPGDEVITTAMTFCATANVVEHLGARPVLVDVEPDTLTIDPAQVAQAITPRSRAIIPVHYAGHPADMDPIIALCREHGLHLLEDAAHALPARYRGRMIGASDNPVAFSFYATKSLTTSEGGMLTATPEFLERARIFSHQGVTHNAWKRNTVGGGWQYDVELPGMKYNMTDLQASLGLHQLRRLAKNTFERKRIAARYNAALGACDALEIPTVRPYADPAWHLYILRLNLNALQIGRDQFIEELRVRHIETSVHFMPLHMHSFYRDKYAYKPNDIPNAYQQFLRMLSLPLNPRLSDQDAADVVDATLDVVKTYHR